MKKQQGKEFMVTEYKWICWLRWRECNHNNNPDFLIPI